jgi:CRISPR-associated protein Cas2
MSDKGFYIVVYDISNDKRRTKLHKRLKDYGSPVQYSVFECILDAERLVQMRAMIRKTVKARHDHVRIYTLCKACLKKTEIIGRHEITVEKEIYVV